MPISSDKLPPAILGVLTEAAKGRGTDPHYLTAYQILNRLPAALRQALEAEYGPSGKGAGHNHSAAAHLGKLAKSLPGVESSYMDARGLSFEIADTETSSGYPVIGIYRLERK